MHKCFLEVLIAQNVIRYLKWHPRWLSFGKNENNMYLKASYQFIAVMKVHSLIIASSKSGPHTT